MSSMALLPKLVIVLVAVCSLATAGGAAVHAEHRGQVLPASTGGQATGARLPVPPPTAADRPLPAAVDGAPAAVEGAEKRGGEVEEFNPPGALSFKYDVGQPGSYARFQNQLRQALVASGSGRIVETVPVLVRQTLPRPPPTWFLVTVTGRSPQEKITAAVRNDNAYVAGFNSTGGKWFAFPRFQRHIQGSVSLPREEDYGHLVGGHMELKNYDIGKEAILDAVRFLSRYRSAPADDKDLGLNLARLIVVLSEAVRFNSIYDTVNQGLQLQEQTRMTEKQARLVVLWGDLSRALIELQKTKKWVQGHDFSAAGVNSQQDAIAALRLMIWPKDEDFATGGNTNTTI